MKKSTRITVIVASSLLLAGLIMSFVGLVLADFNWANLETQSIETNVHEITEAFDKIHVETDTADVSFVPSEDGQCKVVCNEREKKCHAVEVRDGILSVTLVDERKWYEFIGISISRTSITVYLPEGIYTYLFAETDTGDIEIADSFSFGNVTLNTDTGDIDCYASVTSVLDAETDTGHIRIENAAVGSLDLEAATGHINVENVTVGNVMAEADTGKVKLSHVTCTHIDVQTSTGNISLTDVIASETMRLKASTGNVTLDGCDAAEIYVKTSTGNISGTLLTEKIFFAKSSTGKVRVPKSMSGGKCEMSTSTGNIRIQIAE